MLKTRNSRVAYPRCKLLCAHLAEMFVLHSCPKRYAYVKDRYKRVEYVTDAFSAFKASSSRNILVTIYFPCQASVWDTSQTHPRNFSTFGAAQVCIIVLVHAVVNPRYAQLLPLCMTRTVWYDAVVSLAPFGPLQ